MSEKKKTLLFLMLAADELISLQRRLSLFVFNHKGHPFQITIVLTWKVGCITHAKYLHYIL